MTIYTLNGSSMQEIHEADQINVRLIYTNNEIYQYSKEEESELCQGRWSEICLDREKWGKDSS